MNSKTDTLKTGECGVTRADCELFMGDDCEGLPEHIEHELPCCPWCGEEYEASEGSTYTTVPCSCGHNFVSERKVVFVSRASMDTKKTMQPDISQYMLDGYRVEYHSPDIALAYVTLAPLVTEAFAYMVSNETDKAMVSLRRARVVIDEASMWAAVKMDDTYHPGGHRFINGVCKCGQQPTDDPMLCPLSNRT